MGLFDRIFKPRQMRINAENVFSTLTAYEPVFTSWGGMIYESELVKSAVDTIARHCSKLKVEFIGSAQPTLRTMVKHKPNEFMTWSQFLYRVSSILFVFNTCFVVPQLNDDLETVGFFPVLPSNVTVVERNGKVWLRYQFRNGEIGAIEYDRCAILTRFQLKSDFFGDNNGALNDTMGLIHIQNQGIKEAIANSNSFRFLAKLNNFAKESDLKKEADRFSRNNFSAEAKASGLLLFPNTYTDIRQIDSKPYTVDDKQMEYIRSNVERYFGVNEHVINNSASSEEFDNFYSGLIEPFCIQLSEAMSSAVFSPIERSHGSAVLVNANRLQYMSTSSKVAMAKELGDRGLMTINELRELFNYSPIEGGDRAVIRGEYYPLDQKLGDEQNV